MSEVRRSQIFFGFSVATGLYLAYLVRDVLLLIYVSALFAVVVSPAVAAIRKLQIGRWRPSRGLAILVLLAGLLGVVTLFFFVALPPVFRDVNALVENWPRHAANLTERYRNLPFASQVDPSMLQQYASQAIGGAFGLFKGLAGGLFGLFSWVILTAYFVLDGDHAFEWVMSLFERLRRERLRATFLRAERRMRNWLVGQAALMFIMGSLSAIVFLSLGLRYAHALAVVAGALNFVPIIGPLVALVLAAVVAAIDSMGKLLGVLIFFVAYQQLENALLTPRIMRSTVGLPPLAIIIALALGGALAGVLGALVAVPTAALVAVFLDEYLVQADAKPAGPEDQPASPEAQAEEDSVTRG